MLEDIKHCTSQASFSQGLGEGCLVDNPTTRGIDQ
jgi:hypothetical protein